MQNKKFKFYTTLFLFTFFIFFTGCADSITKSEKDKDLVGDKVISLSEDEPQTEIRNQRSWSDPKYEQEICKYKEAEHTADYTGLDPHTFFWYADTEHPVERNDENMREDAGEKVRFAPPADAVDYVWVRAVAVDSDYNVISTKTEKLGIKKCDQSYISKSQNCSYDEIFDPSEKDDPCDSAFCPPGKTWDYWESKCLKECEVYSDLSCE